jgi:hypothetical protein
MPVLQQNEGLKTGNFLNGSDLGTGKSYMALASAAALGLKPVVICRIGAMPAWKGVAQFFGIEIETINREILRRGTTKFGEWIYGEANHATGKRVRQYQWQLPANALLIYDEIHWESGLDSLQSKMLIGAVKQGVKILGLSGTAAHDPRKMRAIGFMLGLHNNANFHQWLARYGASITDWDCGIEPYFLTTSAGRSHLRRLRENHMKDIHSRMAGAGRFLRIRKNEIPGFPKCTVDPVCYDFEALELDQIFSEMNAELERLRRMSGNPRKEQREIMMRAMQKAELIMVPGLVDETNEGIEEGHSVAIFIQFTETAKALAQRLKTDCLYTGNESPLVREQNRLKFQSGEERKIIINVGCGSESIGLQDTTGEFPRLGVCTPTFNPVHLNQLLGRLPRDGAMSPSIYRIMYPAGTILEGAYRSCKAKTERINAFNGDYMFEESDLMGGLNL